MSRMLRVGIVIGGPITFFSEIYAELARRYNTEIFAHQPRRPPVFAHRTNRYLLHRALARLMARSDVVFFEWATETMALATHLPKTCKIVVRLHRFEMYDWADRINWDAVDRVIVVSRAKQREFNLRFPDQAHKVSVLPPAIPLDKFQYHPKPFSGDIGTLCHIAPRKRVYELILTFHELTRTQRGFHLHIGGGIEPAYGDYSEAIRHVIRKLQLEECLTMYGHIGNTQHWYHKLDVFVSNSYSEGLQVAPVEAMASGCYCLSHHWDGADEILPHDQLYFTDSELIHKLLAYSSLPETSKQKELERMRAIACDKFDVKKTAQQICEIVSETVTGTRSG